MQYRLSLKIALDSGKTEKQVKNGEDKEEKEEKSI
jgi:hypothetical protein